MDSHICMASTSGRHKHEGQTTFCISSPIMGIAILERRSKAVKPSLNFLTCLVSLNLSSELLRCTYPSSIRVSRRRRTVVRCTPINLPSSLGVACPRVDSFKAASNMRPRRKLFTGLYLAFRLGGDIAYMQIVAFTTENYRTCALSAQYEVFFEEESSSA